MLTEIQELAEVYYSLISMDHHKTRDTWFGIQTIVQPYEPVKYFAQHAGYISEIGKYGDGPYRSTYDEALADMVSELKKFIENQLDFANRVLAEPADWDAEDIRQATAKIELLTAAGFDWLELKGN